MVRRRILEAMAVLVLAIVLALILAPELLEPPVWPPPLWWWRGLWNTWIGAMAAALPLYVLLRGGSAVVSDEESGVVEQARLSERGAGRLRRARLGALALDVLPALAISAWAWSTILPGVDRGAVLWLHATLLAIALGTGAALQWAVGLTGRARAGVLVVASGYLLLVSAVIWLPPMLSPLVPSQHSGPALIVLNPVVSAYAAARQDILRSGLWYGLSSLGTSRFQYPAPPLCVLPGLVLTLLVGALPSRFVQRSP